MNLVNIWRSLTSDHIFSNNTAFLAKEVVELGRIVYSYLVWVNYSAPRLPIGSSSVWIVALCRSSCLWQLAALLFSTLKIVLQRAPNWNAQTHTHTHFFIVILWHIFHFSYAKHVGNLRHESVIACAVRAGGNVNKLASRRIRQVKSVSGRKRGKRVIAIHRKDDSRWNSV